MDGRVEAVIFASAEPVLRESLARVVGKACNLDLIIDDIRDELRGRPYEIVAVAGGWMFRTKSGFGDAIRAALGAPERTELSKSNALILMAIGYFQPITRGELSQFLGREVSRDVIASLRGEGSSPPGRAARRPARPTPMSPRRRSLRILASRFVTCQTSRSSRMPGGSVGRAGNCSVARRWIPSCGSAGAEDRRGSTTGGCSMMMTDALGRRPARLAFKVRFSKSKGRGRRQRCQYRGRWFESPQLHHPVPANPGRFRVHRKLRNSCRLARRVAVCEPNSHRSHAFCA